MKIKIAYNSSGKEIFVKKEGTTIIPQGSYVLEYGKNDFIILNEDIAIINKKNWNDLTQTYDYIQEIQKLEYNS